MYNFIHRVLELVDLNLDESIGMCGSRCLSDWMLVKSLSIRDAHARCDDTGSRKSQQGIHIHFYMFATGLLVSKGVILWVPCTFESLEWMNASHGLVS